MILLNTFNLVSPLIWKEDLQHSCCKTKTKTDTEQTKTSSLRLRILFTNRKLNWHLTYNMLNGNSFLIVICPENAVNLNPQFHKKNWRRICRKKSYESKSELFFVFLSSGRWFSLVLYTHLPPVFRCFTFFSKVLFFFALVSVTVLAF